MARIIAPISLLAGNWLILSPALKRLVHPEQHGSCSVYPMGYWTDLFCGEQFAKNNTNSVDHSLKLSKSFMISPYREP